MCGICAKLSSAEMGETVSPRIVIVGAGAIGSVVGGMLTRANHDVTFIDQWAEHVEAMRRDGLRLSGTMGDMTVPVAALRIDELQRVSEPFDLAFIAVKSYDTEWATTMILPYLNVDSLVVDFQNGVNDERVAAIAGRERTLGCVITIGAGLYEPGHAMRTDSRDVGFRIGELDGSDSDRAHRIAEIVSDVENTVVTTNLWGERWAKLAVNCMANPIAGLTGYGSADVRRRDDTRSLAISVAAEVVEVGTALGHDVEPVWGIAAERFLDAVAGRDRSELEAELIEGSKSLGEGRPSFLQDVMRKRRTEIDFLNGYVVARGSEVEVATPVNQAVVDTVHSFPVGELVPNPENLKLIRQRLS